MACFRRRGCRGDEGGEFGGGQGAGKVALQEVGAPPSASSRRWRSVSTPSATTLKPSSRASPEDEMDDGGVVGVAFHGADEALVDFQGVEGKRLRWGKRRVAGAEIVDGQGDAGGFEGGHGGDDFSGWSAATASVISSSRLAAGMPVAARAAATWRGNRAAGTVAPKCCTATGRAGRPACRQVIHQPAGGLQHPVADGTMRPLSSATGMKTAGDSEPAVAAPADESFRAERRRRWRRRSGLVMEFELVGGERLAQGGLGGQPGDGLFAHFPAIVVQTVAPRRLGEAQGGVGVCERGWQGRRRRRERRRVRR